MRAILPVMLAIGALATVTPGLAQVPRAAVERVVVGQQEARNVIVRGRTFHIRPLRQTMIDRRGTAQLDLQIVEADRTRNPVHHFRFLVRDGTLVGYGRGLNRPPASAASIRPIRLTGQSPDNIADAILTIEPRPASELGGSGVIVALLAAAAVIGGIIVNEPPPPPPPR